MQEKSTNQPITRVNLTSAPCFRKVKLDSVAVIDDCVGSLAPTDLGRRLAGTDGVGDVDAQLPRPKIEAHVGLNEGSSRRTKRNELAQLGRPYAALKAEVRAGEIAPSRTASNARGGIEPPSFIDVEFYWQK